MYVQRINLIDIFQDLYINFVEAVPNWLVNVFWDFITNFEQASVPAIPGILSRTRSISGEAEYRLKLSPLDRQTIADKSLLVTR